MRLSRLSDRVPDAVVAVIGLLERRETALRRDPFDRDDGPAGRLVREHELRVRERQSGDE